MGQSKHQRRNAPASVRDTIGPAVRAARKDVGFTQAQLAEAADTTPETVSRIERGALEPSASLLAALAAALGTTMDALAGLRPNPRRRSDSPELARLLRCAQALDRRAVAKLAAVAELIEPGAAKRRR